MPYRITPQCSGTDTLCQEACPYNCIESVAAAPASNRRRLKINEELCTDCGTCALVCEHSAIVFDENYEQYQPQPSASSDRWTKPKPSLTLATVQLPEGFILIDGELKTWARLMADSSD